MTKNTIAFKPREYIRHASEWRRLMRCTLLSVVPLGAGLIIASTGAFAQSPAPSVKPPAADCSKNPDPYANYECLDAYLGDNVAVRLFRYYNLEMGHGTGPSDPNAPAGRRDDWPATPETAPPMPFTEWPYGGTTALGVTRPNSVDSPFMTAIANTTPGQWMAENHFQLYGWVDAGANISSNTQRSGGNAPIAYTYTPNTAQLDQTVLYLDRFPDTVQTDHIDWGMRLSAIYGENYRYTTSYGLGSSQLLKHNNQNGYDFPMVYGEIYIPQVMEGLMIRAGRYISLPDIEAQLGPNNYMYTHSLAYTYDNYTNTGIQTTLAITKNLFLQLGVSDGTEAPLWHLDNKISNPYPNALYPGNTFSKDPGAQPTFTACIRYSFNEGKDNIQPCANGINGGQYGYNNLQWYGFTYYHKFNDQWHISFEAYDEHQNGVPNVNNPAVQTIIANGGTPFSPQYLAFNAPNGAHCSNVNALKCTASAMGAVAYLNYSPEPLNNFSFRSEYYADPQGQRTGTAADYYEFTLGWQHWLSPQIEFRPEVGYWRSINAKAFNGNPSRGVAPDKNFTVLSAMDMIFHF
jgi:hypothetical protein